MKWGGKKKQAPCMSLLKHAYKQSGRKNTHMTHWKPTGTHSVISWERVRDTLLLLEDRWIPQSVVCQCAKGPYIVHRRDFSSSCEEQTTFLTEQLIYWETKCAGERLLQAVDLFKTNERPLAVFLRIRMLTWRHNRMYHYRKKGEFKAYCCVSLSNICIFQK